MIIGLIILYILLGFFVFILCKVVEDDAEYNDPEWYESFYKKPRFYRIFIRLFLIIFWPFIIIAIILYTFIYSVILLYIAVKYFYKNLIK